MTSVSIYKKFKATSRDCRNSKRILATVPAEVNYCLYCTVYNMQTGTVYQGTPPALRTVVSQWNESLTAFFARSLF